MLLVQDLKMKEALLKTIMPRNPQRQAYTTLVAKKGMELRLPKLVQVRAGFMSSEHKKSYTEARLHEQKKKVH